MYSGTDEQDERQGKSVTRTLDASRFHLMRPPHSYSSRVVAPRNVRGPSTVAKAELHNPYERPMAGAVNLTRFSHHEHAPTISISWGP